MDKKTNLPALVTTDEDTLLALFDADSEVDIDMLAHTLSPQIALKLLKAFPGLDLKIPKLMTRSHPIALEIGFEDACDLVRYTGRCQIIIPMRHPAIADNSAEIAQMIEDGVTRDKIALRLGVSARQLRRLTRKYGLSGLTNAKRGRQPAASTPDSDFNGGLTGVSALLAAPTTPEPHSGAHRAILTKYGIYSPQPRKD